MSYPASVDAKDVKFTRIELRSTGDGRAELHVEGLVFHSSLAVKSIEVREAPGQRNVMVHLTPTRKGLSGSFALKVEVPEGVEQVTFGNDGTLIWSRGDPRPITGR